MSTLIPPSQRRDVFPANAPHLDALNSRYRREETPKHARGVVRRPDALIPSQVKQRLPIRPVPQAGKTPQPVPPQLRPAFNPYPDRRSSRLGNISTKSSPELRHSMRRQNLAPSSGTSTVRFDEQPELRSVSTYSNVLLPSTWMRTCKI